MSRWPSDPYEEKQQCDWGRSSGFVSLQATDTLRPASWDVVESGGGLGGVDCPDFQQLPWLG